MQGGFLGAQPPEEREGKEQRSCCLWCWESIRKWTGGFFLL